MYITVTGSLNELLESCEKLGLVDESVPEEASEWLKSDEIKEILNSADANFEMSDTHMRLDIRFEMEL